MIDFLAFVEQNDQKPQNTLDIEEAKRHFDPAIIQELSVRADHMIVESKQDAKQALDMAMQARKFASVIEKKRKEIIKPVLDYQRAVKEFADSLISEFDKIEKTLTKKISSYKESMEHVQHEFPFSLENLQEIESEEGCAKEKLQWRFEVEDLSKVPVEFLCLDEAKVKEAIKNGRHSIEGLKIFCEKTLHYRVKK